MALDKAAREKMTSVFRFVVSIDDTALAAFTECTLPNIEMETETLKEGGLNTYVHQLPGMLKAATITLKNGVGIAKDLQQWYLDTMSGKFTRKKISISLLNSLQKTVMTLDIKDAYPIKWSGPQLRSDDNTIAIHSLEFACGEISVVYK
jgi:phage tail-like protein